MKQATRAAVIAFAIVTVGLSPCALSKKQQKGNMGESVFKQNCQSCHAGGANTVNPKKPIVGSSKLGSLALFQAYLQNPLGHMPHYKHVVTDKKTLKSLYDYCKALKPSTGA